MQILPENWRGSNASQSAFKASISVILKPNEENYRPTSLKNNRIIIKPP